jgi:hypothetical protein
LEDRVSVTKYEFAKVCHPTKLENEIAESAIITALDRIEGSETGTDVYFKAALSGGDETILDGLVDAHVDSPIPTDPTDVRIAQVDPDTLGLPTSPKFAPDGWHQQYFETEFETSKLDSIHEKDWENVDIGFSSLKFYDAAGDELTTQGEIDTDCVRTDLLWMPDSDYSIKSGFIAQMVVPESNVYVWALGADLDAAYGGPQAVFADGGMNLRYIDARTRAGLDGVAATIMHYSHPTLGAGAGTNRIRFVVRHPAGFKHRLQAVMEIFRQ